MAGVAIETVAMSGSSLFVLLLTWLVVTRLDGRTLSDLRLRVERRAMVWMLAMMVVAVANVVIVGAVMNLLGIESTAERIKDLPLPIVGALVLHQVNLAFLLQGFPEELVWRGWLVRSLGDGRIAGITSVIGFTLIHLISKGGQEGWIERSAQIGQTGETISPRLYIGLGVSGAVHHTSGIQGAGTVVAICDDSEAPIFEMADFGVVGDVTEVVPQLVEELATLRG